MAWRTWMLCLMSHLVTWHSFARWLITAREKHKCGFPDEFYVLLSLTQLNVFCSDGS